MSKKIITSELYLLIPADINEKPYLIECDADHLLASMKKYMKCDMVECAYRQVSYLPVGVRTLVFIVDECGKICEPSKPLNIRATLLYANPLDFLVGDVVIGSIGFRDGETDIVQLDADYMSDLLENYGLSWDTVKLKSFDEVS